MTSRSSRSPFAFLRKATSVCGLLLSLDTVCQSAAQFTIWGDHAMATEDYYGASRFYAEALQQEGGRMELQWRYAEACRLSNQYPQAAETYEKVFRKDQGRTHPEALHRLGEMQLCSGQYGFAQKTWQKVEQKQKDTTSFLGQRARNALEGIRMALASIPIDTILIEHLPEPVNSYDSEFAARIGPDDLLYFTTLRGTINENDEVEDTASYQPAIRSAKEEGTTWLLPEPPTAAASSMGEANAAWSLDSNWFYYSVCPSGYPCRLFGRTRASAPIPVEGLGEALSTQPMVARYRGKQTLFFMSDRAGGAGGMDIWIAELDGTIASNPRPLGAPVNTPGNESCPFFEERTQQLYFSSDFLPGFGGFDLFTSLATKDGFGTPTNFGLPLNSSANDLYPTFDPSSGSGFFTSNRIGSLAKKGETCCNDIYRYRYPSYRPAGPAGHPMSTTVVPPDTMTIAEKRITSLREKLPIRLYFHNDEPGPRSWDTVTTLSYDQTYSAYKSLVPDYHNAWGRNEAGIAAIDAFFRDNVDHGFAQLNDFIGLLQQALEEGQRIELQVRGFASPLAKSDYNANLSLRRISSMENYLRKVNDGALIPFLRSGALVIRKSPFGEGQSAGNISDQLEDLQGSVYSVGASLERRIEIEQVLLGGAIGKPEEEVTITQDIGTQMQGIERTFTVPIQNSSGAPLTLMTAKTDCDCIAIATPQEPIAPGGSADMRVTFTGRARVGRFVREVVIGTDGEPATFRLVITGVVAPH